MSGSVETEPPSGGFKVGLGFIAFVALLFRIGYISIASGAVGGDGRYYHAIAALVADGKGFIAVQPYQLHGFLIASAPHPPAWPLVLTGAALLGLRTTLEQQVIACLIGTGTVVVVGFAGRRIANEFTGIVAATFAAFYPNFWLYERELMSETLTLFGAAVTVLLAYRFVHRPTRARAIWLGVACGLVAITHAEQLLLVVVLLILLILLTREVPIRRRVGWVALATVAAAVMILPWSVYNSARFQSPVLLGTQFGITVAVSNCPYTYSGPHIGFQDLRCQELALETGRIKGHDEPTRDNQYLHVGEQYVRHHLSRLPVVIAAREARAWSIYPVGNQMRLDTERHTSHTVIALGFVGYWMLAPAAVLGVFVLRRRRVRLLPLLAFVVTVSVSVALTYGFTRFRSAAEVTIVLLAAVAVDAALRRIFPSLFTPTPEPAAEPA